MPGEIISMICGQPAAAASSATTFIALNPIPPPPYSSGRFTPTNPPAAKAFHSSVGCWRVSLQRVKYSLPNPATIPCTEDRSSASSTSDRIIGSPSNVRAG